MEEPLDEFPKLTKYLQHIIDVDEFFNSASYGDMVEQWIKQLSIAAALATDAMREVMASPGEHDDIIQPVWEEGATKVLYTQRMSGDAFLDLNAMEGETIPKEAYREPPDDDADTDV